VIVVFIVSGLTTSVEMSRLPVRLMGDLQSIVRKPLTLLIALLYILGAGSAVAYFPREMTAPTTPPPAPPKDEEKQFRDAWDRQPRVDLGISRGTAKVVVVKFNDWLCPSCKGHALLYQPVLDKYEQAQPGAVKYVIKDWPWNAKCNFTLPQTGSGHEASCDASVAVRLARERSKERVMVDWLFANQDSLFAQGRSGAGAQASLEIRRKAEELLGVKDFDREFNAKLMEIRRDVADGSALNVHQTPTFFINGVRIPDGTDLPAQYFDLAIKIELEKSGGKQ
jgi:protein-disulfide isomerase